ncbi:DUF2782 domain-containing protein [Montanilutibacter psychrotolerans]|uniref:DUF2782 domain-containing protein n=1 Tax=Montanilutibacter psychrotolerans TaxID=1327343 RepID=A0A3M8SNV5_9GAMM|nr:DUF2782 domain-containing protein [Lysobacter psychrotolerans]RNF82365.1 DUF2782 domain-containing protein [Lysobacter psychrotolerans]
MRTAASIAPLVLLLALANGCASMRGNDDPTANLQGAEVTTRNIDNGDVIEEYRIVGQLRVVKVIQRVGPTYYLIDHDGDGRLDSRQGDAPIAPVYFKLFEW